MYHPDFVTLYVLAASRCIIPSCHIEINPADVSDFELAELFDIKYSRDAIQAMLESGQYQIIGVFDEPWDESLAKEYLSFTDGIREYLGPRFKQTFGLQSRKPPQAPQQPISGNLHPALPQPVYTPEPIVPYRAPRYQYQFLLYCPYDYFFQHLGYSFALASPHRYLAHTAAAAVKYDVNSVELSPQLFRLEYCTEQPAPLNFICYARSKLLNLFYPKVTLQPEGAAPQPVDSAMVIRPLIQIGARLMQPTVGYFYALLYLEQGLELREYKIEDPRTGRFWLTLTQLDYHQKNVLVDDNPSHTVRSKEILLYYQRNGVTVESQYLLYRATRPKESDWQAMIARDSHWLSEHAIQFAPEAALQALRQPILARQVARKPSASPTDYMRLHNVEYHAKHQQPITALEGEPKALINPEKTDTDSYAIPVVRVKEYGEPWIILDYAGCAGLAYFIHVEDDWPDVNALGLLTPARNSSYQHPVIEGTLDENGYAKVSIPIELAAHPLNIVVYPPPDWSSVWFNVSSGLQIIGGISSIALACSATLLTGGAATVLSLGLAAWGADQLMTGVNSLVQQQPHKTLMAQGLEQLGASETYAETLTDIVGFANATALANLLVKNSAKLGLSTISISLTERKQQVLLNYISLKTTKLNRKFSLRREKLSSAGNAEKELAEINVGKTVKQKIVKNSDGLYEVTFNTTPLEGQSRLNTFDTLGNGKLNPAEAAAAARMETVLGRMERVSNSTNRKTSADYIINNGSNKGKTIDLMYTTSKLSEREIIGINKFFEKNMTIPKQVGGIPDGQQQILEHLNKADFVPIDLSVLNSKNQKIFMDYIRKLSKRQQDKIIIMR